MSLGVTYTRKFPKWKAGGKNLREQAMFGRSSTQSVK